jgi:hypothetical protein
MNVSMILQHAHPYAIPSMWYANMQLHEFSWACSYLRCEYAIACVFLGMLLSALRRFELWNYAARAVQIFGSLFTHQSHMPYCMVWTCGLQTQGMLACTGEALKNLVPSYKLAHHTVTGQASRGFEGVTGPIFVYLVEIHTY